MRETATDRTGFLGFLKALGPAVIVASVVLGPGSILSNSKVGAAYGLGLVWVLLLAAALMVCAVALGARLGITLQRTLLEELAARLGRPFAVLVGLTVFLIVASFQFGNNLGILAAIEPWLDRPAAAGEEAAGLPPLAAPVLVALNALIVVFLFGLRRLYRSIERMMMVLVGLMLIAFVGNLGYILVASGAPATELPPVETPDPGEATIAALGLLATTFSIAGAFYQSYLVREKGWGLRELRQGLTDSFAGITVLAAISLVIMASAALSFHGRSVRLESVADVARQLDPLFGPAAVVLFSLGIFAGAFSSFLVNAMIGGTMLSNGLGLGGRMDSLPTKLFTTLALLAGLIVAVAVPPGNRVGVIVLAQALTVIGLPLLAFSLCFLATSAQPRTVPRWMQLAAFVALVVVLISAVRLAWTLYERFAGGAG